MNDLIVKLHNRNNKDELFGPLQLSSASDSSSLAEFLNTIKTDKSTYIFYFKDERIITNLEFIRQKNNFSNEEIMEITYIDEKDIKPDYTMYFDDVVRSIVNFDKSLYIVTYNGKVYCEDKIIMDNICNIFASSKLFAFDNYRVFDLLQNKPVFKSEFPIHCCTADEANNFIVIGTDKLIYCLKYRIEADLFEEIISPIKTNQAPREIFMKHKNIYWIEGHNKILIFNIESMTTNVLRSNCTISSIMAFNSEIYATTFNNKILKFSNEIVVDYAIDSRFSNCLRSMNDKLIYSTQHHVSVWNIQSMSEMTFLKVDGQINDLLLKDGTIFVANDNKVDGFLI